MQLDCVFDTIQYLAGVASTERCAGKIGCVASGWDTRLILMHFSKLDLRTVIICDSNFHRCSPSTK